MGAGSDVGPGRDVGPGPDDASSAPLSRGRHALRAFVAALGGVGVLVAFALVADRPCSSESRSCLSGAVETLAVGLVVALLVFVLLCRALRLRWWVPVLVLLGWTGVLGLALSLDAERAALPVLVAWAPAVGALVPPGRR